MSAKPITKKELLAALDGVPDDASIIIAFGYEDSSSAALHSKAHDGTEITKMFSVIGTNKSKNVPSDVATGEDNFYLVTKFTGAFYGNGGADVGRNRDESLEDELASLEEDDTRRPSGDELFDPSELDLEVI